LFQVLLPARFCARRSSKTPGEADGDRRPD